MSYTIHRAHVRDVRAVKPFWKSMVTQYAEVAGRQLPVRDPEEAWQRRYQEYMTWINEGNGVVFIAVDDRTGESVGYAAVHFAVSGSTFDTGETIGELETLAVAAEHRGHGLGMRLIESCRAELRKRDIPYWSLDTLAANQRATKLYTRAGFTPFILRMVQHVDDGGQLDDSALTASMAVLAGSTAASATSTRGASAAGPTATAAATADTGDSAPAVGTSADEAAGVDPAVVATVEALALAARGASIRLGLLTRGEKDRALLAMADAIDGAQVGILAANREDLERGRANGLDEGLLDRLRLDPTRLRGIATAIRQIAGLADPVGEVVRGSTLANGIQLRQVRVPLGVVGIIYEARPNVTADAAALALKSGNAVLLRGGSAAAASNHAIVEVLRDALAASGVPADAVGLVQEGGRDAARALMRARGLVDVIIPRGGADLIATVVRESTVPVIETGSGNVHVYVDAAADLEMAVHIVVNAKTQRPSVCNAAETLLVHEAVAGEFLPDILRELDGRGVVLYGDDRTRAAATAVGIAVLPATETEYATEFHSLKMAVAVVDSLDEAMAHVARYSTGHTEAIVTNDRAAARRWTAEVDAAVVAVNASTRFTDGGEFGFGAEIGISTQKLHARGPMALTELTSTKWIVEGDGQVRGS